MRFKFYNPFKWHVVEYTKGVYAVRKRSILPLWWVYSDIDDFQYTWDLGHIKYCLTPDREKAIFVAKIRRQGGEVAWS